MSARKKNVLKAGPPLHNLRYQAYCMLYKYTFPYKIPYEEENDFKNRSSE